MWNGYIWQNCNFMLIGDYTLKDMLGCQVDKSWIGAVKLVVILIGLGLGAA